MGGRGLWTKLALGVVFISVIGYLLTPYFQGSRIIQPVWLRLGGIELYWYGFLMAIAVLVGLFLVLHLNRTYIKLAEDPLFYLLIWTAVGGFIGARLLFVILKWPLYSGHLDQILQIHSGGMSIHGAILGGALFLWWGSRIFKLPFRPTLDMVAIVLPISQAIGRFGNFFNQEAFGGPTNLPWKMYVEPAFRPVDLVNSSYFHPTFLYEAVGNLIIAGILWTWFVRRHAKLPTGSFALWYLILYSIWRFVMEFFRIDSDYWFKLTVAQWGSLGFVAIGLGILVYLHKENGRN